jgi:hypothetical protein
MSQDAQFRERLAHALEAVAELAAISGKVASSRPDSSTDVLILNLGHLRTLIEARSWLRGVATGEEPRT